MTRSWTPLFIFLSVTVCGFGAAPLSETPPTPKDVARSAVEAYNQQTSTDVVFRFLQLRTVRRKKIRDCFAEATVLDFMDDAPLTSVECHEPQMPKPKKPASPKRKKQKAKRQPQVMAEDAEVKVQYFINSYSTAGLTLAGAGTDE
ncbi:uncharacterized protein LOC144783762 isoform X2 [Lissotriton helveticus]